MRKETIIMWSDEAHDDIEKEYDIYTRDELIEYIRTTDRDLSDYDVNIGAPCNLVLSVPLLQSMEATDEFLFNDEYKEIMLLME